MCYGALVQAWGHHSRFTEKAIMSFYLFASFKMGYRQFLDLVKYSVRGERRVLRGQLVSTAHAQERL